jgi:hypothetical protein
VCEGELGVAGEVDLRDGEAEVDEGVVVIPGEGFFHDVSPGETASFKDEDGGVDVQLVLFALFVAESGVGVGLEVMLADAGAGDVCVWAPGLAALSGDDRCAASFGERSTLCDVSLVGTVVNGAARVSICWYFLAAMSAGLEADAGLHVCC